MWTWMKGDSTFNGTGNFGTIGTTSTNNNPPAMYSPFCWTDLNGNFWLFGGGQGDFFSSLWKYELSTNSWTWENGVITTNQPGSYGVKGIPSPTNYPGSRLGSNSTWVDKSGNLWLFGGIGFDIAGNLGALEDLWKYNIASNEWTWMAGYNLCNVAPSYGTIQVPATSNSPGGRWETGCTWNYEGALWLFGGTNYSGELGDVWKYLLASNEWVWMQGSSSNNQPASYGTKGVSDPSNTPGTRASYCSWIDKSNSFWTFGGYQASNSFADLWKFDCVINEWTWVSGSDINSASGLNGGLCKSSANFYPGARMENRSIWNTGDGDLWVYGGCFYGTLSMYDDLWRYRIDSNDWTLVSGDTLLNQDAYYGVKEVASSTNLPGGRCGTATWLDSEGNIWLFGGCTSFIPMIYTNDLWKYTIDNPCSITGVGSPVYDTGIAIPIYPNPSYGNFMVELPDGQLAVRYTMNVTNSLGQEIFSSQEEISSTSLQKTISLQNIPAGSYFLEIKSENIFLKKKIIISK